MAIIKKPYEISIWSEILGENGQKIEHKDFIIGAHDMTYAGRAVSVKFETKLNGTHTLTFSLPDRWCDSKTGEYVRNEFIDQVYNERKVKFFYKEKWYEFYVKSISDSKNYKSYMKTYTCNDAFIDELSRNGYGLTFDEELYNNVEELGTFTEEIVDDSIWYYAPENNWGDFTEFLEEKLFKIPVSQFSKLEGYKLNYNLENSNSEIINAFTSEKRAIEMGDDLARAEELFWDQRQNNKICNPLTHVAPAGVENDGFIYVPYSQLNFCYKTTVSENQTVITATEEPCFYSAEGIQKSYALSPATIDPSALIQFIAIPKSATVEVDEAGTIVNKNYTYVMTVKQWNDNLKQNKNFYQFEPIEQIHQENGVPVRRKIKKYLTGDEAKEDLILTGNFAAYYDGYLNSIGDLEILKGKKISISDRTEINATEEIDQYVKVYNNLPQDFINNDIRYYNTLNENKDWIGDYDNYRVCSKTSTRQVIPQLARNLVQNGINIRSTDGWEVVKLSDDKNVSSSSITFIKNENGAGGLLQLIKSGANEGNSVDTGSGEGDTTAVKNYERYGYHDLNTVINFGIVGQNISLSKEKIYVLGIKGKLSPNDAIIIGEGNVISSGDYKVYWEHQSLNYTGNFYSIASFSRKNRTVKKDSSMSDDGDTTFIFIKPIRDFANPYIGIWMRDNAIDYETRYLEELWFFEAYTKGRDQFSDGHFKYSGRELIEDKENVIITEQNYTVDEGKKYYSNVKEDTEDGVNNFVIYAYSKDEMKKLVLFEDDVMPGDTYEFQQYFIQQFAAGGVAYDTFKHKKFLSETPKQDEFDLANFTEDDLQFNTAYFNLSKCPYYKSNSAFDEADCSFKDSDGLCLYQKYGYCPYLFQTEKHCRKVRTLKKDKSNRFNLTQELSKIFKVYPIYYTNNSPQGAILKKEKIINGKKFEIMDKRIFYITEKGKENKLGFRYEKNLSNISRTLKSDQIVTKLYVQDVDSDLTRTGLCSIKTAEDNPSKDNFIIDFSYYISKGIISAEQVERDLYGIEEGDMAYLKQLGYYNSEYDKLSNLIINLQSESYTELEANIDVNFEGIVAAKQQVHKLKKQLNKYKATVDDEGSENNTIKNTITKYKEQIAILNDLYNETFDLTKSSDLLAPAGDTYEFNSSLAYIVIDKDVLAGATMENFKDTEYYKKHVHEFGMLGQFNREYRQIQEWKKLQSIYLKKIKQISLDFFQKYEPYIKEGTWTDSNYITDNAYYFGALEVAAEGAIPKVSYTITTVDLSALPQYSDDYTYDIADTTYIEDIGMFGVNEKTGLPNRLKVLVSGITENPDQPTSDSITVQNYTTQFEDLFKQVSATVQSLTYNENVYKRSSNFTSNQNIKEESLQGTLDSNNLDLLKTQEENIRLNAQGQAGSDINNHSNKYKLNGQGLFFSNNGGQSWNVGVGPAGINADYIKVGNLDAGKVKIVDNDFLYFYWDKNGIMALKEPQQNSTTITNSYAMFNKYGLSLVEKGKIKLRAGYNFNGSSGSIDTETVQSNELGFYLYDSVGRPIFVSSPSYSDGNDLTARLSLRGEIFVTDGRLASESEARFYNLTRELQLNSKKAIIMERTYEINESSLNPKTLEEAINEMNVGSGTPRIFQPEHVFDGNQDRIQYGWNRQLLITSRENFQERSSYYKFFELNGKWYLKYTKDDPAGEWYVDTEEEQSFYLITNYGAIQPIENGTTENAVENCDIRNNSQFMPSDFNPLNIFYPTHGFQEGNVVYVYDNKFYSSWIPPIGKDSSRNQTIGLFLNNKINNENNDIPDNARLFSCIKQENNDAKNILSIIRNGNLYIGGDVESSNTNILNLGDTINIREPGIALVKNDNGQYEIRMDFKNIKNTQQDQISLTDYVSQNISISMDSFNDALSDQWNTLQNQISTIMSYINDFEARISALEGN